jgi:hypothetical protein
MSTPRRLLSYSLIVCLWAALSACATVPLRPDAACPDNLVLQNGEEIPGLLVRIDQGEIRYLTLDGQSRTFAASSVVRIDLGQRVGDPAIARVGDLRDVEVRALIDEVRDKPRHPQYPYELLLVENRRTLTGDNEVLGVWRELLRVNSPAGLDRANVSYTYDPKRTTVQVDFGYAIAPDGRISVLSSGSVKDSQLGGDDAGSRMRRLQIAVPRAEVGGFVYYQFSFRTKLTRYYSFHHSWTLAATQPIRRHRTIVRLPRDAKPSLVERNLGREVLKTDVAEGHERVITYQADDPPIRLSEPYMPDWSVVAPHALVVVSPDWATLAQRYHARWLKRVAPQDMVTEKAKELTAGKTSRDAAAALYAFVLREVRDNGAGMWSRDPFPKRLAKTLGNKRGNLTDRTALLYAMAKAVGLEVDWLLVSPWWDHEPTEDAPLLRHLTEPLLRFRFADGETWCHLGNDNTVFGQIPDSLAESFYLHPESGATGRTPINDETAHRAEFEYDIYLSPDGGARIVEQRRVRGSFAWYYRGLRHRDDDDLRDEMQRAVRGFAPRNHLADFTVQGMKDLADPVVLTRTSEAPLLTVSGGGRYQVLRRFDFEWGEIARVHDERRYPLERSGRQTTHRTYRLHLPKGMRVATVPPPLDIGSPWSRFRAAWQVNGDEVTLTSIFVAAERSAPASTFAEIERFLRQGREYIETPILLEMRK